MTQISVIRISIIKRQHYVVSRENNYAGSFLTVWSLPAKVSGSVIVNSEELHQHQ